MSVLACERVGCQNIMCDRYSERYGYICHQCFEEMVQLATYQRHFPISQWFIGNFMDSTKSEYDGTVSELIEANLNEIFSFR